MASEGQQHIAMLRILLAVCETALHAFHAADNPLDDDFVTQLQQVTDRTREELSDLTDLLAKPQ
ncbi:MAG: hypothetical protein H0V79_08660 [Actinobacteria bacterium]|nr:hypothetical protein [Actinomycetota bacterium]